MLSLTQLEVLIAVVERGGFSGAAKKLYMSQPSVSNHVRNLESSIGAQLVRRSSLGAQCTPAGEVVVEHARRVFALLDELERRVADLEGMKSGRLIVAGTTTLGTYLLPRLVADFTRGAPNVECQIRVGNEETVENWLLRGEVALGLCIGNPREEQLISETLFEEEMVLVAAGDSPLRDRVLRPADLAGQRFLMREVGSATRRQQDEILRSWGLADADRWNLWGPETLKEAVCAGLGLTLLSGHATARERQHGLLAALSVDPPPPGRTVSLVRRGDRVLTPPEQAFVTLLAGLASWPG